MGNPKPYKPPSIEEQGGPRIWLDLMIVRAKHNGLGWDDLVQRIADRMPLERIADDFNVKSTHTIRGWLRKGGYIKKDWYWVPKEENHELR